jgi:hypothetical protein
MRMSWRADPGSLHAEKNLRCGKPFAKLILPKRDTVND